MGAPYSKHNKHSKHDKHNKQEYEMPPGYSKIIKANDAKFNVQKYMRDRKYQNIYNYHIDIINTRITNRSLAGYNNLLYHTSEYYSKSGIICENKEVESELYKKLCSDLTNTIISAGYQITLQTNTESYYGIPNYEHFKSFLIEWTICEQHCLK